MKKPMVVWGLLLFIGFLATQYLAFTVYDTTLVLPIWIILVVIGAAFGCKSCSCKKGVLGKKKTCNCGCCSGRLVFAAPVGIILTAAILLQLIAISPFYIISVWMILVGSAMVAKGMAGKPLKLQLGLLWLFSAVFFPFVSNYQGSAFYIGALVMGVPLMLVGLLEKDKE